MTASSRRIGKLTGKTVSWYEKSGKLSNRHCLYCGIAVGGESDTPSNKEHLIGRNFVPSGSMGGDAFNFLFRACVQCNSRKAVAERHISSVTLINGPGRQHDPRAAAVAERKEINDFHPDKPGVAMGRAHDTLSINSNRPGFSMSVGFTSPPRANDAAVAEIAVSHVQGLFSLLTTHNFQEASTLCLLPARQVRLMGAYGRSDWGNPHLLEVTRRTQAWSCHANIISADGYFKATMRRHETQGWFWALEWNKFLRVAGGIAHGEMELFESLPDEKWFTLPGGRDRAREEVPLPDEDDVLFIGVVEDSFL